jgi:chromatin remodeling complex protein RSC6
MPGINVKLTPDSLLASIIGSGSVTRGEAVKKI